MTRALLLAAFWGVAAAEFWTFYLSQWGTK